MIIIWNNLQYRPSLVHSSIRVEEQAVDFEPRDLEGLVERERVSIVRANIVRETLWDSYGDNRNHERRKM